MLPLAHFSSVRSTIVAAGRLGAADVVPAPRDGLSAQVGRIPADADLAPARAERRLTAGVSHDQDQR